MKTLKEEWIAALKDWRYWVCWIFLGYAVYAAFFGGEPQ